MDPLLLAGVVRGAFEMRADTSGLQNSKIRKNYQVNIQIFLQGKPPKGAEVPRALTGHDRRAMSRQIRLEGKQTTIPIPREIHSGWTREPHTRF